MAKPTNDPDWLTIGAEVVMFTPSERQRGGANIVRTTVARLTPRDVVLANGERFRRATLERSLGQWAGYTYLLHPDDERVLAAMKVNGRVRRLRLADEAWEQFKRNPTPDAGRMAVGRIQAAVTAVLAGVESNALD